MLFGLTGLILVFGGPFTVLVLPRGNSYVNACDVVHTLKGVLMMSVASGIVAYNLTAMGSLYNALEIRSMAGGRISSCKTPLNK